jgi:hypothetical protein
MVCRLRAMDQGDQYLDLDRGWSDVNSLIAPWGCSSGRIAIEAPDMAILWMSDRMEPKVEQANACSLEMLIKLLDNQLRLNARLEVYDHLDHCSSCRNIVYHMSRSLRRRERFAHS